MPDLIKSLTEEHGRMAKLLSFLDHEIEHFKRGNVLDYVLMSSILDYLTRATQLNHHIIEDEIYKQLLVREPQLATSLVDLPLEHEKLSFLCDALKTAIENVEQDNELPRMWLVSVANEYRFALKRHLRMEENDLFPLAEKTLTADDWKLVETKIDRQADMDTDGLEKMDLEDLRNDILDFSQQEPLI